MMLNNLLHTVLDFVQAHAAWAPFIAGALAFCESLAVVSFFVPATLILVAIGGIIGPAHLSFTAMWAGAALGAILGDWLSYLIGRHFKDTALTSKFADRHRTTVDRAVGFMQKWGALGVFIGRFSGPLRAFVPLVAGILGIPQWLFQAANITSAIVWAGALLSPGTLIGKWMG